VTLHAQWIHELKAWLQQGYFNIFPYTIGKKNAAARKAFWDFYYKDSVPADRRIIVATIPVRRTISENISINIQYRLLLVMLP
jgi:hypothetical protein